MRRFLISLLLVGILMLCLGVAAAQNYDDVKEFEVQSSVSAAEYRAGYPITFTVNITEGTPPFSYSWELFEAVGTTSFSELDPYINNFAIQRSLPSGTTNDRKLQMTYTPPVLGLDINAVCYVYDRDGKVATAYMTSRSPIDWAATYAQYVLGCEFLWDSNFDLRSFFDSDLSEEDYNNGKFTGRWRQPKFSLYDLDPDGIPELLLDSGGDFAPSCIYVFTYKNHQFQYTGFMPYHEFVYPYVSATPGMPGIYYSTGNMGSFDTSFNFLSGTELDGITLFNESIYIYDDDGNIKEEAPERIFTWYTKDQRLIEDYKKQHKSLVFYPLAVIREMGWWNGGFLDAEFTTNSNLQSALDAYSDVVRLIDKKISRDAVIGYQYYKSLPSNWLETMAWIDLFQGHISSLDMTYNRRRFLFTEAIQMCTTKDKKAKFVKMNDLPDGLVLANKELKFEEAAYARTVKNLCDPAVLQRNNLNTAYFDKLVSDTVDGKRSFLDTQQDLAQLGMSSTDVTDIMSSIDLVDTIHVAGKMAKTYSNVKKAWNSVAEIANKWSLLDSLDRNQMLQIAASYKAGGSDMQAVAEVLETFAKADKAGQIALITSDKMLDMGLDYLFDFLSATLTKEMAKVSGSVAVAAYALTYAAIDYLTGVGDLTTSYTNLVFAGETVDHFWNNVTNFRGFLGITPSESNLIRAAYAYVDYCDAAAELDEKYAQLVQDLDKGVLSEKAGIINDVMRQDISRCQWQSEELRKSAQEMIEILKLNGLISQ